MEKVRLNAVCFKAGDYSNIGRSIYTEKDLNDIVARTNSYGLQSLHFKDIPTPLTIEHIDSENTIDLGGAVAGSFKKVGEYIEAMLEIPKQALDLIKSRFLSIEISPITKIIKKITITNNPVIEEAKFSNGLLTEDVDTEYFSFSIEEQGVSNMITNINQQNIEVDEVLEEEVKQDIIVEEVEDNIEDFGIVEEEEVLQEEAEIISKVVVEEVMDEEPQDEFSLVEDIKEAVGMAIEECIDSANEEIALEEDMACATDKPKDEEKMSEQDMRIKELEARIAELEDENWKKTAESYSIQLVSNGVPPVIANAMAPWLAREESESFSKQHYDYIESSKQVIQFFSNKDMFKVKLQQNEVPQMIKTDEECFSSDAIMKKLEEVAKEKGIDKNSNQWKQMIATEVGKASRLIN